MCNVCVQAVACDGESAASRSAVGVLQSFLRSADSSSISGTSDLCDQIRSSLLNVLQRRTHTGQTTHTHFNRSHLLRLFMLTVCSVEHTVEIKVASSQSHSDPPFWYETLSLTVQSAASGYYQAPPLDSLINRSQYVSR